MDYKQELRDFCKELERIEWNEWKPVQVFRSDEQVARDEARHQMASEIADMARALLARMTEDDAAQGQQADELELLRGQVDGLVSAAAYAIPECEHPAQPSPENWAQQIRNLGDDRRAAYKRAERAGA